MITVRSQPQAVKYFLCERGLINNNSLYPQNMSRQPLIDLDAVLASRQGAGWSKPFIPLLKSFLKIEEINEEYDQFCQRFAKGELGESNFFVAVLRHLNVNYEIAESDLHKIPKTGALMALGNHPFGGIDGLVLGAVLTQARPDARLLANELLCHMDGIRPYIFGVNVFGGKAAAKANLKSMKQSFKWLESGGCVATFPSGTVSHFSWKHMMVVDPAWNPHITSMAQRTSASVLPVFFPGKNSLIFQLAGMIHPLLRTLLISREFIRMKGKTISVRIGKPVAASRLQGFQDLKEATQFLRLKSYVLRDRSSEPGNARIWKFPPVLTRKKPAFETIVPAVDPVLMEKEVAALPEESRLFSHGTYDLYLANADEIPATLQELGRLREITFREIGEGTGTSIDLDEFDPHYLHLFIWNRETSEVVGAYRMGLTDKIMESMGKRGLYTTTLFKLKPEFLDELNPAIELGRSFIRPEYQRKHATLSLLWKGIGTFIGRNPQYSRLFGPVSITAEYSSISKDLMVQFLKENMFHTSLSKMVKARHPHRSKRLRALFHESMRESADSLDDISAMISEIEFDQKGVPVLLKHYLKLNGVMLSFNRDPKFCDVVDGLILVDLEQTDPHVFKRYIGEDAWKMFHEYQEKRAELDSTVN